VETKLWAVSLIVFSTVIGAFGSLFFKKGADRLHRDFATLFKNWRLAVGFLFYIAAASFFIYSLQGGELSVLYPLVSLTYVWVCLLSVRFVGEEMNRLKWAGVLFIVFGVSLIGLGGA